MAEVTRDIDDFFAGLFEALGNVEQQAQEIRWRLSSFIDNLPSMDFEIAGLAGEVSRVAVFYGQMVAIQHLGGLLDPCDECSSELGDAGLPEHHDLLFCEGCDSQLTETCKDDNPLACPDEDRSATRAA